jgi:hypothetical protein
MSGLKSRLVSAARLWAAAQEPEAPLSRLGKKVAGDAGFFTRIESPAATLTIATLERFAQFLVAAEHWPDGEVPDEVCQFAHVVGGSGAAPDQSPDTNPAGIAIPVSETERGTPEGSPATGPSGRAPAADDWSPPSAAGETASVPHGEAA